MEYSQENFSRKELSPNDVKQLRRLFENSQLTATELMRIIKPYGFYLDSGGKHPRILHQDNNMTPQNQRITDRGNFFPLPSHGQKSISPGVLKGARTFVYERLPPKIREITGFTPLKMAGAQ